MGTSSRKLTSLRKLSSKRLLPRFQTSLRKLSSKRLLPRFQMSLRKLSSKRLLPRFQTSLRNLHQNSQLSRKTPSSLLPNIVVLFYTGGDIDFHEMPLRIYERADVGYFD